MKLMIDPYLMSVLVFFGILAILIYKDRKKFDIKLKYLLFMRRTKRFSSLLDNIAQKSPLFWKIVGTIGVIVCLLIMANGVYSMIYVAYLVSSGVITQPAVQIALPIPSPQMSVGPGIIGIPFWFWIITIAIILIPHEAFHGIIARAEKIRLKDVGLMLLAIFPGAFVEPDEKQLEKSKLMTKLRIFSAGSFVNILIGFAIVFLVQYLIWAPSINGIVITSVNETSPAGMAGLHQGMVIQSMDARPSAISFNDYSYMLLLKSGSNTQDITTYLSSNIVARTLSNYKPGDNITLKTSDGDYTITLAERSDVKGFPYIGIGSRLNVSDVGLFDVLFPLLGLMSSLSILVGTFNILPIFPLDGGLVVKSFADRFIKKKKNANRATLAVTAFMVLIIAYSIVMPIILNLF
jgi:membrane-associated protease RseP (regulator of RpoE activity)